MRHPWPGFAVVTAVNLVSLVVILLRRDIIWAIAATWICISIWAASPKPAPVFVCPVIYLYFFRTHGEYSPRPLDAVDFGGAVHGTAPACVDISARLRPAGASPRTHRVAPRRRVRPARTSTREAWTVLAVAATTCGGSDGRTEAGATWSRSARGRRRDCLGSMIPDFFFISISMYLRFST